MRSLRYWSMDQQGRDVKVCRYPIIGRVTLSPNYCMHISRHFSCIVLKVMVLIVGIMLLLLLQLMVQCSGLQYMYKYKRVSGEGGRMLGLERLQSMISASSQSLSSITVFSFLL